MNNFNIADNGHDTYHINNVYTKGLLFLALTVMGNYVAETLGCSTQKLLNTNRIAKLSVIFFLIYFTLNIAADIDGKQMHPLKELGMAFILWIAFIIFTKTTVLYKIIIFISLCLHYVLGNFNTYYNNINDSTHNDIVKIIDKSIVFIIIITTIVGFIKYILKEKREHHKFSWYKFFIGVDKCHIK
jgi:hypothetical protein